MSSGIFVISDVVRLRSGLSPIEPKVIGFGVVAGICDFTANIIWRRTREWQLEQVRRALTTGAAIEPETLKKLKRGADLWQTARAISFPLDRSDVQAEFIGEMTDCMVDLMFAARKLVRSAVVLHEPQEWLMAFNRPAIYRAAGSIDPIVTLMDRLLETAQLRPQDLIPAIDQVRNERLTIMGRSEPAALIDSFETGR
ncbi:MAG: hypothetical protein JSS65_06490 [Armatimonadetes bacterium]|nr:hypothetical protein [Armatimonadota bacterium]